MKRLAWLTVLALVAAPSGAERFVSAAAGSEVVLSGTSTLHDWKMTGPRIDGEATLTPESAVVSIPVDSIHSENKKMDRLMREALDAKAHPAVLFRLATATLTPGEAGRFTVKAAGKLTIKGTTKDVTVEVAAEPTAKGGLVLTGQVPIVMTDYGVKPPVAMLGTIKTKPGVVISFRWVLDPAPAAAAP